MAGGTLNYHGHFDLQDVPISLSPVQLPTRRFGSVLQPETGAWAADAEHSLRQRRRSRAITMRARWRRAEPETAMPLLGKSSNRRR